MLSIRKLSSDAEIESAFSLTALLRDRIRRETFLSEVRVQRAGGYRLIGGFDGNRLVILAGIRSSTTLARGPHLFVDDLVTDPAARGQGHGRAMLRWIEQEARRLGLPRIYLDSRDSAQQFYAKAGYTFLTSVPCWRTVP